MDVMRLLYGLLVHFRKLSFTLCLHNSVILWLLNTEKVLNTFPTMESSKLTKVEIIIHGNKNALINFILNVKCSSSVNGYVFCASK